jgi:hypothetical protein
VALEAGGSSPLIHPCFFRPHRLAVRSPPFQGGGTGSNPVGVTLSLFRIRWNSLEYQLYCFPCYSSDNDLWSFESDDVRYKALFVAGTGLFLFMNADFPLL